MELSAVGTSVPVGPDGNSRLIECRGEVIGYMTWLPDVEIWRGPVANPAGDGYFSVDAESFEDFMRSVEGLGWG